MLGYVAYGIANPIVHLWLATSAQSWRNLPTPIDTPIVHAPGADPDRVLLLGSGIAVGYGVMSHALALGGHLARELSALTGRGASVDIIGRGDMSPASTRATLAALDLSRFDALVLTLGGLEGFTLMPSRRWRRQLSDLIDELHRMAPASLAIFFVEIGAPLLAGLPRGMRGLVLHAIERLNAQTAQLCAEFSNTTFVAFAPAQGDLSTLTGRTTYRGWAELISPALARILDAEARTRQPDTVDEVLRQQALDALDLDGLPPAELDHVVESARDLFGATGASVTVIDHGMQRTMAAIGMSAAPIPRSISLGDLTIRHAELLVVEDTMTDPRIAGLPWADGARLRFYAGYPIESPDGQRVGALCIVDRAPRQFSDTDAALLRQLALRVQTALWNNRASG